MDKSIVHITSVKYHEKCDNYQKLSKNGAVYRETASKVTASFVIFFCNGSSQVFLETDSLEVL